MSSKLDYLRSLPAIRERCSKVHALAQEDKLHFFEYHPEKEEDAIKFCLNIINVGISYMNFPPSDVIDILLFTLARLWLEH